MSRKFIVTGAFPEPEWTQVPNKFFEMLPEMESSEVRVTLIMIRETYGYHRESFKMGLGKLAEAAGLSRNAAKDGAEAAEIRGTFRRSNPEEQTEAEWELVVGQPVTMFNECIGGSQPVTTPLSTSDSQVGIKESIKKEEIPDNYPIDWYIQHGLPIPPHLTTENETAQNAMNEFESKLGFSSLPWDGTAEWQKFKKWVVKTYLERPTAWADYSDWRKVKGKYDAMSNKQIRMNPSVFMDTGWPSFLAYTAMYDDGEKTRLL